MTCLIWVYTVCSGLSVLVLKMVNILKFQTLYSTSFWHKLCFFLFPEILSGMASSVYTDQTAPQGEGSILIWVCTVCIYHFVRNFSVWSLRILPKYSDTHYENMAIQIY